MRDAINAEPAKFHEGVFEYGAGGALFPGVLWAQAEAHGAKKITKEMIENASVIADVPISDEYKEMMVESLNDQSKGYEEIYELHIPNAADSALVFDPVLPGMKFETQRKPMQISKAPSSSAASAPKDLEDLAFASARELAELVRTKKVSSVALTEMYLSRLKKYDSTLKFVVTLTEEHALAQAKEADAEIAAGKYRGPCTGCRGAQKICWQPRAIERLGARAASRNRCSIRTQRS